MKKKAFVICMAVIACIAVGASAYSVFAKQFVNLKGEKISYKSVSSASASAKSKHLRHQPPNAPLSKQQPSPQRKKNRKAIITAHHRACLILLRLIKLKISL